MKNSSYTIRNRTRDIPACSAVPQTTAPPLKSPRKTCIFRREVPINHEVFHIIRQAENPYMYEDTHSYRFNAGDAEGGWKRVVTGSEPWIIKC
jgi:hypothetical protein